ncbi:sensor histidine kinase [Streptomyces sp. AJS327]|uniref:sensor histidine kinase n=1 Tax=Streptomyces sp. AJS327 TaxID=2545265 RepID=UPI0015DEBF95|nr:sensor histidine kinase [Streptomyces sp. AJS327]MBA0050965.1 sensor histidine kinase [Streptomyces sp. AJS327]
MRGASAEREDRWLSPVLHTAFFLLLGASLARYLHNHPGQPLIPWVLALSAALALLYVLGPVRVPAAAGSGAAGSGAAGSGTAGRAPSAPAPVSPAPLPLAGLGAITVTWVVLVLLAPSFAWCAVPLVYTALRSLPPRAAVALVTLLTALVVFAQLRLAEGFDPHLVLLPPAVAALATAVFLHTERQAARQRALIDDLLRTRRELAATERREGGLAERQRLSMEIHDTLAQGLSSQQLLLQAAERIWEADPAAARAHVRTAAEAAGRDLAEARRFVHDLAPSALAGGAPLETALRELAAREHEQGERARGERVGGGHAGGGGEGGGRPPARVRFHREGAPVPLPESVAAALLRVAQGALANAREHAEADTVALTLSYLGDQVVLDVADDGRGFDPPSASGARAAASGPARGYGLPAMRARVARLGGTLTVESTPEEGTVLSAAIPLEPTP